MLCQKAYLISLDCDSTAQQRSSTNSLILRDALGGQIAWPGAGASVAAKKAIYRRGIDLLHVYLCGAQPRRKLTTEFPDGTAADGTAGTDEVDGGDMG